MIEAVLFDWGNTLVRFEWSEELVVAGHRAALGNDDPEFTARWRDAVAAPGDRPYPELLRDLGIEDPAAFMEAEYAAWRPASTVLASAQALLESLRTRGIKTGVVSNTRFDPPQLVRADAEAYGLASLLDVMVFSQEVGARKPEPGIFLHALEQLGIDAADAMFVGDGLVNDVQGAANVGMSTVQALWFVADDTPAAVEPDFMAFTPMDVLNAVRRLAPSS
jgi:HAD superfamily hydrolase (TIGR01662 family)